MSLKLQSMKTTNSPNPKKNASLNLSVDILEISIVLIIKDFNPNTINLDSLKYTGVIPDDWEIDNAPILNKSIVQFSFVNKVKITVEPNRVIFSEVIDSSEDKQDFIIPALSHRFIESLNKANYQSLGFNSNCLVVLSKDTDLARRYITEKFLRAGSWYKVSTAPVRANINYIYTLENCQLNLNVQEATFQLPEQPAKSAILFTSNFHYDLSTNAVNEKTEYLSQILTNWKAIIDENKAIIHSFFG
jgi:hypothetical protein